MTDLVERLRAAPGGFDGALMDEAADEIERLRRERDEQDRGILASSRLLADNAAEIEKLQAQVVAQTTDNPITRAVGWWEGPIPAAGRADDAKVMRIWRECELPEYFLGNGGSNHKLVAFVKACAADEIERLRLRKRPVAWVRYVCGTSQFQHASDAGDPPEDEGWIALYRRGE